MMADRRATNRAMFWRIIRRLFGANRGRLIVMLLALGAGAAVTAALLNLQVDAKRRLTTEFRAFGANVLVTPGPDPNRNWSPTLPESVVSSVTSALMAPGARAVGLLYTLASVRVSKLRGPGAYDEPQVPVQAVMVGYSSDVFRELLPHQTIEVWQPLGHQTPLCTLGINVAHKLKANARDSLVLDSRNDCFVQEVDSFGGPEDNQIFVDLASAQRVADLPAAISLVEIRIPGTPRQIEQAAGLLQRAIPGADVRPIRQFTEGEAKIYNRISGLLRATVGIVLLLTGLCVMAAMTNVAMERKNDVGLMKAIGGSVRRVLRLFLAEAALLGLAGGMIGAAAGIFLSIGLGKAVFGVAARPRLIVYPVAVALTIIVAILSAYPLRRLASIRPASVFRGEA
jgi:ABC-type lipoprotein release transport system permease subunit